MNFYSVSSIEAVQNSAFCSIILWHFGRGYQAEAVGRLPEFHLSFLVLPIILYRPTLDLVSSTFPASGIGKFVEKLGDRREELHAVHPRALAMRRLTLMAISTGVAANIISVRYEEGRLRSNDIEMRRPSERVKPYTAAADKLGRWVSRVPAATAFSLMQVSP